MSQDGISFERARADQAGRLADAVDRIGRSLPALAAAGRLSGPGPVFVGIGASHAAACGPVWQLRSRGIHSWRLGAGDYPVPFPASTHPVVGVSQSGRSSETLAVLESIRPDLRYAVVNRVPSPVADAATVVIDLGNIPDSYASTIGYTATVAALGMLAEAWDGGAVDPTWSELAGLLSQAEPELAAAAGELAALFGDGRAADFVGAGPSVGSAEAAALLFREVARVPAAAMSTRQYLHGSMESAGSGIHVLFGRDREAEVARTLAAAGHQAILVTDRPAGRAPNLAVVPVPDRPPAQRVILEAQFAQVLAAEVARRRSIEIEEFVFHNSDTKVPAGMPPE
ncbi:MAG TPA: hypothetical protein VGG75_16365 [Trebonia sp.]|jgi:glucosamine--fructose-6-phosphate aminotransferase (isomerizing)